MRRHSDFAFDESPAGHDGILISGLGSAGFNRPGLAVPVTSFNVVGFVAGAILTPLGLMWFFAQKGSRTV
jgi:hypothetical protein